MATPVAHTVRNADSGFHYARVRVAGKLIWKSLKTGRMTVAQLRLGDFLKQNQSRYYVGRQCARIAFTGALSVYLLGKGAAHSLRVESPSWLIRRVPSRAKASTLQGPWPWLRVSATVRVRRFQNLMSPSVL